MNKIGSLAFGLILQFALILTLAFYVWSSYFIDFIATILIIIIYVGLRNWLRLDGGYFWAGSLISTAGIDVDILLTAMQYQSIFANNMLYLIGSFAPAIAINVVALIYSGRKKKEAPIKDT